MNLQSILLSVTFFTLSLNGFSQEVKIKNGIASVDGKEYVRVSDCGIFATECSIRNMEGEELIFINNLEDPKNPGSYFQVVFIGADTKIEIKKTIKPFIKLLFENKTVNEQGKLNPERVKILFEKYGNQISLKN